MSGHSKWHNIKNKKGKADAQKSSQLAKISKEIIVATQIGGSGDVNFNTYLRVAVQRAKALNMTNDRIENAINRGLGRGNEDNNIEEKTYEAYGFGGSMLLIDCETDNPNRTLTDIKTIIGKSGGKVVSEGSISWQFEEMGIIKVTVLNQSINIEDDVNLPIIAMEGVVDVFAEENEIIIQIIKEKLKEVVDRIKHDLSQLVSVNSIELAKLAKNKVEISEEDMDKTAEMIDKLREIQEVVNIWTNLD